MNNALDRGEVSMSRGLGLLLRNAGRCRFYGALMAIAPRCACSSGRWAPTRPKNPYCVFPSRSQGPYSSR
jgi:hypothetical protein